MTLELAPAHTASTAYMFGVESFYDGPCAYDYDPIEHAARLRLPVIFRKRLPRPGVDAVWSERYGAIFALAGLSASVERCAIAHEIVHFENGDVGEVESQERRADRIAARRLIRPSRVAELADATDDLGRMALHLDVTEHAMAVFFREYA